MRTCVGGPRLINYPVRTCVGGPRLIAYPVKTCVGGPRLIAVSLVMYESIGNTEGSNIESKKLNVKSYHQKRKKVKQTRI